MSKRLLVADLFCGAGGSSTGARRALEAEGLRMRLVAVNHWPVAIETHQRNHPDARHYCVNLDAARPAEIVPEGRLDLLMASPECTHFSRARGGKPTNDQSRMSAWHVVRWCTELRVRCLLIENVPEFMDWGPVDLRTGKPIKRRKGEYFRSWIKALEGIGYKLSWRVLNAADFGEATTRERLFIIGRCDRRALRWPEPSHSKTGDPDLYGAGGKTWRPAREVIDWSLEGKSIFNRKRPLSPKTLARIYAGAQRFNWPEPFLVVLRQHMDARSLDEPLPTICAAGTHIGLAQPVPFVLPQGGGGVARELEQPMPTIATDGAHALVAPYYGTGVCSEVERPLPTVTTKARFGLVVPVTHHDSSQRSRSVDEPLPTITGAQRGELAFIAASFGEREGQSPRVHSVEEPVPTICASGHVNLVEAREHDILFRMLQPHELAAAMGFHADEAEYEFTGTKTDIIKQIGNAVPVRVASALVGALLGRVA